MTKEILSKNQELINRLEGEGLSVWSGNDFQNRQGMEILLTQVAEMIDGYTNDIRSKGEMLSKNVEELMGVSENGRAALIARGGEAIGFAALWPLVEKDGIRVSEFGSWIVKEEWRHSRVNGVTIGELVAQELLDKENGAVIATIKRANSMKGLSRVGFRLAAFSQFPMVSALTCSCATSEHYTDVCSYRRADGKNGGGPVVTENSGEVLKIPCSLMVADVSKLEVMEGLLLEKFEKAGGSLKSGVINRGDMAKMRAFYFEMGVEI